jgi:hypothetical protein
LTLEQARAKRLKIDWAGYVPPKPSFIGAKVRTQEEEEEEEEEKRIIIIRSLFIIVMCIGV